MGGCFDSCFEDKYKHVGIKLPALSILSAGSNAGGQLGNGTIDDSHNFSSVHWDGKSSLAGAKVKKIACGSNHTLILLDDGQLWVSGSGLRGQLGPIKSSYEPVPFSLDELLPQHGRILDIAASWETSYLVIGEPGKQDTLLCMGANDYGDLGAGTTCNASVSTVNRLTFEDLFDSNVKSDSIKINSIASGPHHVVVSVRGELEGGEPLHVLAGWGASRHGQVGEEDEIFKELPNCFPHPRKLSLSQKAPEKSISCGNRHTVIVHEDGNVSSFGSNKKSQLEGTSSAAKVKSVHCTWNGTCLVHFSHKQILLSGSNNHGQLGIPDTTQTLSTFNLLDLDLDPLYEFAIEQVSTGSEHVLVLLKGRRGRGQRERTKTEDNKMSVKTLVLGWGWNEHGNLGVGHTNDISKPQIIWPTENDDPSRIIESVWTGCGTSWLVLQ